MNALTTARPLGASGLLASPLWLGTMMFGDQTDEAQAGAIVDAARAAGVNAIDSADVYAAGDSERMLARLLKADRAAWVIATKAGNPMPGARADERGNSRRWLRRAVDASLQRLDSDWIDLYYLHRDDDDTPPEETVSTLARLIDEGRIRYWGVSNFRAWRVAQFVETARRLGVPPPIACQPPYSLVTRGIEAELLPCCAHYGVGVVAYSPLARGVLSGKYQPGAAPPAGSRAARSDRRLMQTEWRDESIALSQQWAAHAAQRGQRPGVLAIAWALANRHVAGVIGGPRTLEQWQDYLDALQVETSADDEAWVDARVPPGHASSFGYTDPAYPVSGRQRR